MSDLPEPLAPLAILLTARRNAADYYAPLLDSRNDVLRIGAWSALLDRNEVTYAQYPAILALAASNPGIRRRAIRHFMAWWDDDFARPALDAAPPSDSNFETALSRAELAADEPAMIAAQREFYLATGLPDLLAGLVGLTERAKGWRAALPTAVEQVALNPHDPHPLLQLFGLIHAGRDTGLIDGLVNLLQEAGLQPAIALLYASASRLLKGDPAGCLQGLGALAAMRTRPDVATALRTRALEFSGEAHDKLGDYRKSYAAFAELNKIDQGKPYDLGELERTVMGNARLAVPPLPPDGRSETLVMTGFPRSGTTLLENALAAHPAIETFEEIPSWSSLQLYLDLMLPTLTANANLAPVLLRARERYYVEIDRLRRKPDASALIDKMPIRAADAVFFQRLFPDKRVIFSIRHPFDVVLSCFKQQFVRNMAMEHFRTFENAAKLYDFTMSQWFSAYSFDDPRVHYLRYDSLVLEFEPSMRGVFAFLGLDWDAGVLDFARGAETRGARTPSYMKVRQGLTIGVQSNWRNYGFLFQSDAARPLRKWVAHFGYEGL